MLKWTQKEKISYEIKGVQRGFKVSRREDLLSSISDLVDLMEIRVSFKFCSSLKQQKSFKMMSIFNRSINSYKLSDSSHILFQDQNDLLMFPEEMHRNISRKK